LVPSYGQNFSAKPSGVQGSDLRADIRFVVIGFALAGAIGGAAAQYFPPQPPPAGYPPSAHDPYPASPPPSYQRLDPYPDTAGEPYDDQYDWPYPAQPLPTIGDTQRQPPDGIISEPLAPPATSPQDRGTEVAALPPEYQPERGPPVELRPQFRRTVVDYPTIETPGTIIIDTPNTYLYLTLDHGKAIRYGIGVGREGFTWSGTERISRMKEWPDWLPPKEMIARQPYLPRFMAGGETNPLGARAMYLGNTVYRIHGTNQPSTIGGFVSSGCIRLTNEDVEDLYSRVAVGTTVVVLPGANMGASQLRSRQ
jgi:lipoprotein-anchoring transpeptidase ErfK/SrfK